MSAPDFLGVEVWIKGNVAELIVVFSSLLIGENAVGRRNLLEPFFGLGVPFISVRVVFLSQASIGLLNRRRIGGSGNAKFRIWILILATTHCFPTAFAFGCLSAPLDWLSRGIVSAKGDHTRGLGIFIF